MDRILNKNKKLINNIIYSSMVFTLAYLFGLAIGVELNIALKILFAVSISLVIQFFLLNPLFIYILLAIIFVATIFISRYFTPYMQLLLERVYFLFENIINHLRIQENILPDNQLFFWGILITLLSLFTGLIIFKYKKINILLPLYIGSFIYYWYNFFDEAYWMLALFLFLFFILKGLNEHNNQIEELYTPWLKTTTRYALIIIILALLFPKRGNLIHWSWLENRVYSVFPSIKDLRSTNTFSRKYGKASSFDFSMTGFQEEPSRLGGPVQLNEKKIMTLYAEKPMYLRGNIRHIYTGNAWESSTQPLKDYRFGQDLTGLTKEEKDSYYNEDSITITYHSFSSTTLFSPYKATIVSFDGKGSLKVSPDGQLILNNGVYSGESYLIKILTPLPYHHLMTLGIDRKKEDVENLSICLQIPEDRITDSTRKLVKEIVKDAETDFEKALAIENHLRSNYKYNLNVEIIPENREFIDYFLFESKEGYCTYYATAMAIMLRLEGIPTRYIEGYLARDLVEENVYEVKHSNAHTWIEAFIEPIGWMIFEPTPAYPSMVRLEESPSKELYESTKGTETGNVDIKNRGLWEDIYTPRMEMDEDIKGGSGNTTQEKTPKSILLNLPKNTPIIFIGILLLFISMRFFIGFMEIKYKNAKIKKLPNKERVLYLYNEIIKLTHLLGYAQEYGETHYEYADRIAGNFYFFTTEKGIKEITEVFVRNKYSNFPTPDEDVLELEKYRETMEKRLKNHLGLRVYYYRKYFKNPFLV